MAAPTARKGALSEKQIMLFQNELRFEARLDSLSSLLSAAGNETRIRILYLLWRHGEIRVNDLAEVLGVSTPAVSQQLKKLRRHRLVNARREAQAVFYSLQTDVSFVRRLIDLFERFSLTSQLPTKSV
jgi:ArsR family transcriptional regulator, lead/cadmium/zinc/bismuth-responsive transcriptional repressor